MFLSVTGETLLFFLIFTLLFLIIICVFLVFIVTWLHYSLLASSSFLIPAAFMGTGCSPFPTCSSFGYWIQRKASPLEEPSPSKCLLCYITAEGEALKGGHTESCETLATQLLLTVAQIIIKQFYSGSIRPFFILAFLTVTLLWQKIPNERVWN